MNKKIVSIIFLMLLAAETHAAGSPVDAASLSATLISNMAITATALSSKAMIWLGAFAFVQFVITNLGLLKSGADIEAVVGKLIGSLLWIGFCTYVLKNGPDFISGVGEEFFSIPGLTLPTVGTILLNTGKTAATLGALAIPVGVVSNTLGMFMVYLILATIAIGCFFAFKIFMLQLELGLVVMLSPLSFSFLGINALKDQGIAPFKSLISLGYRVILIGVILSGFTIVDNSMKETLSSLSTASIVGGVGAVMESLFTAFGSYLLIAYLLYKSDSIAASLAGGSTSMGTADVASAAAMGAAAGAVVASGGAAAAGAASKPAQSMADFMKNMGGGGEIKNAASRGVGPTGAMTPPAPLNSMTEDSGKNSSAKFETGSRGQPLAPESSSSKGKSVGDSGAGGSIGGQNSAQQPANKNQNSGGGSSFLSNLKDLGRHIEQDKAATHVSINTHHSD